MAVIYEPMPRRLTNETGISEFQLWNYRLQEELGYMLDEPASNENLAKIGDLVNYYFDDLMFRHEGHEVCVYRLPDGGIAITVVMEYADREDYYDDFELLQDEADFEMRMNADDVKYFTSKMLRTMAVGDGEFSPAEAEAPEFQSPDDILFAPIKIEEEKKPSPVYDNGDYCD